MGSCLESSSWHLYSSVGKTFLSDHLLVFSNRARDLRVALVVSDRPGCVVPTRGTLSLDYDYCGRVRHRYRVLFI